MNTRPLPHTHNPQTVSDNLQKELANIEKFQLIADVFKQLGEECVINISAMMEMSSPAISHHLRLLRSSGLIVSRREGKEVYYHAADTEQSQLLHKIIEQVIEVTCPN